MQCMQNLIKNKLVCKQIAPAGLNSWGKYVKCMNPFNLRQGDQEEQR